MEVKRNYLKILQDATNRISSYSETWNEKFEQYCEDLYENLSYEDWSRVNNLFVLLTGISLKTLLESEDIQDILGNNYFELLEHIGE